MFRYHARARVFHNCGNLGSHKRIITMYSTFCAGRLLLAKRTFIKTQPCVVQDANALLTNTCLCLMMCQAIYPNHRFDSLFFPGHHTGNFTLILNNFIAGNSDISLIFLSDLSWRMMRAILFLFFATSVNQRSYSPLLL